MEPIPIAGAHRAELFDQLVGETGLTEFIAERRIRGEQFYLLEIPAELKAPSIVAAELGLIVLVVSELDRPSWEKKTLFLANLLHELGHREAFLRCLDRSDELLAWDLAEEICPVPLPAGWATFRSDCLATYGLNQQP